MSSAVRGCHINEPVTQCCCTVFYLLECVVAVPSWLFAVFLDVPMYLQREIFEVSHGNFCHMDKLYCHLNDVDWWLPRDTLHRSLPQSFRETFPKKTCIIDATELFTERHSHRGLQSASFSRYKHHHTVKALVAISPCSHVMLVSRLFTCAITDKKLTKQFGFSINLCLEIKS